MKKVVTILTSCLIIGCSEPHIDEATIPSVGSEEIIEKYLKNGAWKHHYLTKEWDRWISQGIEKDSTIAQLWQQKALPYWKQRKYQKAISYYDKAVEYDRQKWLSRLGFLKCIFAKDYVGALGDLEAYKREFGTTFEQEHSLEFYIGLCHLQLNQYDEALTFLQGNVRDIEELYGKDWVRFLDRFYLAIAYYELNDFSNAITQLDEVLNAYPDFSDAQFYKSLCLKYTNRQKEAEELVALGRLNYKKGNTFNEDSSKYEVYPYQVTWEWSFSESIIER